MRLFIGIDLPIYIKNKIYDTIKPLTKKYNFKWVSPDLYHLTLKFLGEVSEDMVHEVDKKLKEISKRYYRFNLRLTDFGKFPVYGDKVVVIWVGVENKDELNNLAKEIMDSFNSLGDNKPFSPHITIARNKNTSYSFDMKFTNLRFNDHFEVKEIVLFQSFLYPSGPKYEIIKAYALKL